MTDLQEQREARWFVGVDTIAPNKCSEDCERQVHSKGLCRTHYNRRWRGESPEIAYRHMTDELKVQIIDRVKKGEGISQVAQSTGYNVAAISRMFKREVGMGIRQWRATQKTP